MNATSNKYDAKTIHGRATRLLARHTQMGFTKDGKSMVIDQAFELVAAEEGYRNQHELRAAAQKQKPADIDVNAIAQAEKAGRDQWHDACNRLGWNEESQIVHLEGFLADKGLMAEFGAYAQEAAQEEEGFVDNELPELEEVLEKAGYSVQESEFDAPYWSLERVSEYSADFPNDTAAWSDAWRDAQQRTLAVTGMARQVWDAKPMEEQIAIVRNTLSLSSETVMREAANEAFENYDFGADRTYVDASGWEWTVGGSTWARTVFLRDTARPDSDSVAYRFSVEVMAGKAASTNLEDF
jgi:hypothetical protein